jgi:RimJ/RimL family protein N-acetyltransferase
MIHGIESVRIGDGTTTGWLAAVIGPIESRDISHTMGDAEIGYGIGEAHQGRGLESRLRKMIRGFQNEPNAGKSHQQWKEIEKEIFGVDYRD